MLRGLVQPAFLIGDVAGQEMPFGVLPGGGAQQLLGLGDVPDVDLLAHLGVEGVSAGVLLLIGILLLLLLIPARLPLPSPAGAGAGDGVIGLVDLFHLFLGQIGQRIVLVVIRMILPGQLPIGALDFLVAGAGVYAEYAVWIVHGPFLLCLF